VIVAVVLADTAVVVTVNVMLVVPARTVTAVGTIALELFDPRLMRVPDGPAGPLSVTVPVEDVPPITVVGKTETLDNAAAVIVKGAV